MNEKILKRIGISILMVSIFFTGVFLGQFTRNKLGLIDAPGYRDIDKALTDAGYQAKGRNIYEKEHHGLIERIVFDFGDDKVLRNNFVINIKNAYVCPNKCYLQADKMEEILLQAPYTFALFGTKFAPLIAHAGGGYRTQKNSLTYTNSYEAIKQNYELGHRFFEIDFNFTTDKKLAAIHDWENYNKILNEQEWLRLKKPPEFLQHLTLARVLDMMLVHRDMFLITDSKAFELDHDEQAEQFNMIYEEIIKRDSELLNRVIPQTYSKQMMDDHAVFQAFPNVIFTGYAAGMSSVDILKMLDTYPNIQMFTTNAEEGYIDDQQLVTGVKQRGKKLSIHTVNEYRVFTDKRYAQVDGYYTDFLTPRDWQMWKDSKVSTNSKQ